MATFIYMLKSLFLYNLVVINKEITIINMIIIAYFISIPFLAISEGINFSYGDKLDKKLKLSFNFDIIPKI